MKKFLFLALLAVAAISANAQGHFTGWWGGNISTLDMKGGSPDSEFKPLNIGVSYTAPIKDAFDWSAGVAYVTKGCEDWDPGFLQLEGNGAWNFVNNDALKVGLFTGPYLSFLIAKDDAQGTNTVDFGWQGGVKLDYKFLSFKVGYEYGFLDLYDGGKSLPSDFFFRIGYNF